MSSNKICCVPGCQESGGMHNVLHGFLNPDMDKQRYNSWLFAISGNLIGLETERIFKYRRVCHAHFEDKYKCRNNRISNIAVPTLNMPDLKTRLTFPHVQKKPMQLKESNLNQLNHPKVQADPVLFEDALKKNVTEDSRKSCDQENIGGVMTASVFANSVNSNAITTHRGPNLLRSSSNRHSDSKMDNSAEMVFQDLDVNEEYTLQLSPNTALRARNDLAFATNLLNVARQEYNLGIAGAEVSQATSNDGMLEDAQDALDAAEEMNENSAAENKENFRWSESAILLLLEEYRLREPSMSSGKTSHVKAWKEISAVMELKGYNVSGRQCMTRLNTMKRTYKAIKDHNGKTGNNRRPWKYYDAMESLIGEKPFMAPLATISSTAPQNDVESSSTSVASTTNQVTRKRKASDALDKLLEARQAAEEGKERRHKERMEMQTKMINFLSQLASKE